MISRLKALVAFYGQLENKTAKNELNNKTEDFSSLFCQGYGRLHAESIEQDFQKIAKQRESFEQLAEFIKYLEIEPTTTLIEDRKNEVNVCKKFMNENSSAFSTDKLVFLRGSAPKRDYIKTLFKHVDTLSKLQLHCKSRHSGLHGVPKQGQSSFGNVKAVNPFVVLKDNISDIFGRLLFDWNMSPKR